MRTGIYAAHGATTTIPIVMATGGDLVAMGLAESLAHPGGNITGVTFFIPQLMAEMAGAHEGGHAVADADGRPMVKDAPANGKALVLEAMGRAAKALNVELAGHRSRESRRTSSRRSRHAADERVEELVVLDHAFFTANAAAIAALAAAAASSFPPARLNSRATAGSSAMG